MSDAESSKKMLTTYEDAKPIIRGHTLNKHTASATVNTIRYDYSAGMQDARVTFPDETDQLRFDLLTETKPILDDHVSLKDMFPCLIWVPPAKLYEQVMVDARDTVPRNSELMLQVNDYYTTSLHRNLNNLYQYAPKFFHETFLKDSEGEDAKKCDNGAFEDYQKYIYLLCFVHFVDTHRQDPLVRDLRDISIIQQWISTRRDASIPYIINGPTTNSEVVRDYRAHYNTMISPTHDMEELVLYNQLATEQTISADLLDFLHTFKRMHNVYDKTPDQARKYTISIVSNDNVYIYLDDSGELVFDLSHVSLGEPTDDQEVFYEQLDSTITNNRTFPRSNTRKLAEIMHNYSMMTIKRLSFAPHTYISNLSAFDQVYVVFRGLACKERNTFNVTGSSWFTMAGRFVRDERGWFNFTTDSPTMTYSSVTADVKKFELYLTTSLAGINLITGNDFTLRCSKRNVLNIPITTDIPETDKKVYLFDVLPESTHNYVEWRRRAFIPPLDPHTNRGKLASAEEFAYVRAHPEELGMFLQLLRERDMPDFLLLPDQRQRKTLYSINEPLFTAVETLLRQPRTIPEVNELVEFLEKLGPTPDWYHLNPANEVEVLGVKIRSITDAQRLIEDQYRPFQNIRSMDDFRALLGNLEAYNSTSAFEYHDDDTKLFPDGPGTTYELAQIDLLSGTINGRFFTITPTGDVDFNVNGPDYTYIEYPDIDNDLTLIRLVLGGNSADGTATVTTIDNGTFMYSHLLGAVQNIPGTVTNVGVEWNHRFRFDPTYNLIIRRNGQLERVKILPDNIPTVEDNEYHWRDFSYSDNITTQWYTAVGSNVVIDSAVSCFNSYVPTTVPVIPTGNWPVGVQVGDRVYYTYSNDQPTEFDGNYVEYKWKNTFEDYLPINDKYIKIVKEDGKVIVTDINHNVFTITEGHLDINCSEFQTLNQITDRPIGKELQNEVVSYIYLDGWFYITMDNILDGTEISLRFYVPELNNSGNVRVELSAAINSVIQVDGRDISINLYDWPAEETAFYTTDDFEKTIGQDSSEVDVGLSNLYGCWLTTENLTTKHWSRLEYICGILFAGFPIETTATPVKNLITTRKKFNGTWFEGIDVSNTKMSTVIVESDGRWEMQSDNFFIIPREILRVVNGFPVTANVDNVYKFEWGVREWTFSGEYQITAGLQDLQIDDMLLKFNARTSGTIDEVHLFRLIDDYPWYIGGLQQNVVTGGFLDIDRYCVTFTMSLQTITKVTITYTENKTYKFFKQNDEVYVQPIFTMKYSSIPGETIDLPEKVLHLSYPVHQLFRYHPRVKYSENLLISPEYTDSRGHLKPLYLKNNYTPGLHDSYLRNLYTSSHPNITRDPGQPTISDQAISPLISPEEKYLAESINTKVMCITGVKRSDDQSRDAVKSTVNNIIPDDTRIRLDLEFM